MGQPVQSQADLKGRMDAAKPATHGFVKDAPILGYRITNNRFDEPPEVLRQHLGATDQTQYTPEYLGQNIGSIIALQMNGAKPDFYVIGKGTFDQKYRSVPASEVGAKNAKLMKGLMGVEGIDTLVKSGDPNVVGALKTVPVEMVRMSEIGYSVEQEVKIQSPWGEQTKPAGKDAFLVWDAGQNQYYMVNTDNTGLPISYVSANPARANGIMSLTEIGKTNALLSFLRSIVNKLIKGMQRLFGFIPATIQRVIPTYSNDAERREPGHRGSTHLRNIANDPTAKPTDIINGLWDAIVTQEQTRLRTAQLPSTMQRTYIAQLES